MGEVNYTTNKRIARNTLMLYARMLFTMLIGLYTSRVILATLGVDNYGIYNVVGGFVSMFSVISATMTTATQRFLSFEIGKGSTGKIQSLFSTAVIIHVLLAFVIFIVAETLGVWFLNYKMNFPEERVFAANWVFQLSVMTFMISVASVPYSASLIAYERMKEFAYMSVFEVVLKLIFVFLLQFISSDRLIVFAIMIAGISVVQRFIYGIYVKRNFKDCRCTWKVDKECKRQLLGFISWNFIGSLAGILKEQGLNVVLNIFFGAAINAARGVAYQVLRAISGFVSNFQLALNPQIVKHYAANEKQSMFKLVFWGSKCSYLLMMALSIPVIIEAPYILRIWLVKVPNYTVIFIRLVLLITLVDSLSHTLLASVHASGKVKWYQIINGSILLLTLPIVYLVLKCGGAPYTAMLVSLVMSVVSLFVRLSVISKTINFPMAEFIKHVVFKVACASIVAFSLSYIIYENIPRSFFSFAIVCLLSVIISLVSSLCIAFDKSERLFLFNFLKKKFSLKL